MMPAVWVLRNTAQIHKVVSLAGVFSLDEIKKIKQIALAIEEKDSFIAVDGLETNAVSKEKVRKCKVKWIEPTEEAQWIYQRLVDVVHKVNGQFFNLNLYALQSLQYTMYDEKDNGFYAIHRDSKSHAENGFVRKLSFSLQLTDPSEYAGGDLVTDVGFNPVVAPKELGAINFFLSDILHEARPITKGSRHALVGWVIGPPLV